MGQVKINCIVCKRPILIPPSLLKRKKYCSKKCQVIGQIRQIKKQCPICHKTFHTIPSAVKNGRGKTCSRKCQYILIGKKAKARNPKKKYKKKCRNCNEVFYHEDKRQVFCQRQCWLLWNCGENHFNYIDGSGNFPHPLEFNDILKEKIRERDNYVCRYCGATKNYRGFPVHHIDYDKTNNEEWNLITLCDTCHQRTNYNREYWQFYFESIMNDSNQLSLLPC